MIVYTGPWWLTLTRGVLSLVFGALAVILPGLTLITLAIVFGAYAVAGGVVAAIAATRSAPGTRAPHVWEAVILIVTGLLALVWPAITVLALVVVTGVWAIVSGVGQLVFGVRAVRETKAAWLVVLSGALGVLFGILVLVRPGAGIAAIAFLIGFYAIVHGVLLIALGIAARRVSTTRP
ncbi:DUF308 domain-containing protein [Actinokineospora sp. NBRC 105648]|uniref:HdeD family acid-resistance protein n=1 Tax=Actinokineospora sp. NBRC 105648 TaxID=3032206 RepID=UPI0024A4E623|nr:DUF308 domain-containing protein [Actinokineospora sp. NBRC 105648]GLZ39077.1 membrane protein [Actinokineospora sp. NBRC 105648]